MTETTIPIKRKTVKTTAKETVVKKKSVKKTVENKDKDVNQQTNKKKYKQTKQK